MSKQVQWIELAALMACSLHASAAPTWKKGVTIPVVTEGSACNSTTDKIAVTSTNQILSCQSGGFWAKAAGTATMTYWPSQGAASCSIPNVGIVASGATGAWRWGPTLVGNCLIYYTNHYHCVNGTYGTLLVTSETAGCISGGG